ncbi:helix-turn-helix domain-containing protein [Pantoea sp. Acro-807]|uniref:helix-turn-helix domain-containing protein n=1 Tax=Pantoea sp. Acro-807 TaxID=2608356 RepID=UPI001419947E|nr:helix-turn-helix domain-containing protein [Pantoea sp. Acro-807]NIE72679.1 helix-turn-helix domain-containing protein [Pantoea sp. Acro-807]
MNISNQRESLKDFRSRMSAVNHMSGKQIKELRERFELSQAMLAEFMNLSVVTISKWERNEKSPNGAALVLLNALDIDGVRAFSWRERKGGSYG